VRRTRRANSRWRTTLPRWTDKAEPQRLWMGAGGTLTAAPPTDAGTTSYVHTVDGTQGIGPDPTPAQVTVWHGPAHASSLVLPVAAASVAVPEAVAGQANQPACGSMLRQPCRPDPLA
jgi:hypothetical protein